MGRRNPMVLEVTSGHRPILSLREHLSKILGTPQYTPQPAHRYLLTEPLHVAVETSGLGLQLLRA